MRLRVSALLPSPLRRSEAGIPPRTSTLTHSVMPTPCSREPRRLSGPGLRLQTLMLLLRICRRGALLATLPSTSRWSFPRFTTMVPCRRQPLLLSRGWVSLVRASARSAKALANQSHPMQMVPPLPLNLHRMLSAPALPRALAVDSRDPASVALMAKSTKFALAPTAQSTPTTARTWPTSETASVSATPIPSVKASHMSPLEKLRVSATLRVRLESSSPAVTLSTCALLSACCLRQTELPTPLLLAVSCRLRTPLARPSRIAPLILLCQQLPACL
jgi:hypothetical protein